MTLLTDNLYVIRKNYLIALTPREKFYELNRRRFFQSDFFFENYEQRARENLKAYFELVQTEKGISCG